MTTTSFVYMAYSKSFWSFFSMCDAILVVVRIMLTGTKQSRILKVVLIGKLETMAVYFRSIYLLSEEQKSADDAFTDSS